MRPAPPTTPRLTRATSPVPGLAVYEHRVDHPRAVVICVHGGLDRGGSFSRLARRLDTVDVVAYDRRGYQGSRSLRPLGFSHQIDDLVEIERSERARHPVVLFGHSFGGLVALAAAAAQPTLVDRVILYETPLPWILERVSGRPAPTDDPAHEAEQFFRRVVSDEAWERLSETERQSRRDDGPALLADLAVIRGPAPFDLAAIRTPIVLVHGDGHLGPYYRALGEELRSAAPSVATIEMAHAGHGAHLSRPSPLAELITGFVG